MEFLGKFDDQTGVENTGDRLASSHPAAKPKVLMLGGFGRSGSTLLERCLAQCEGFSGLGEVIHLWERGLLANELCGCSRTFADCGHWQDIGRLAYGGWDAVDPNTALADRLGVVRNRYIPELAGGFALGRRRGARARLVLRLNKLYLAAQQSTGADILVDSSKHPAYAYLLRSLNVDLRCVLVVRDPRGVAYSWSKVVKRPETGERMQDMPRYTVFESMVNWTSYSLLFHALTLLKVPVMTVHYEDFMRQPQRTLERIARFGGATFSGDLLPALDSGKIVLDVDHTVAGNPMRFKIGEVALRLDEEWKSKMTRTDRTLASILSLPLRVAYGAGRRLKK
ncbi:sulfotransferase [Glutamicibacter mysorens]